MFGLGVQELLLILVIILIFFGAEKLPQLAQGLGKGIREFRKAQNDIKEELNSAVESSATDVTAASASTTAAMVICPACQGRTPAGGLYCSQCGQPLNAGPRCSVCQQSLQPDDKFCSKCGNPGN